MTDKGALLWDRIHRLEKGQIYKQVLARFTFSNKLLWFQLIMLPVIHLFFAFDRQGNLYEFLRLTGWRGSKVLYFGDHIYSDLAVRLLYLQQTLHSKQQSYGNVILPFLAKK